jgi:uncharacterized protein YndB with AHSA1/START domain
VWAALTDPAALSAWVMPVRRQLGVEAGDTVRVTVEPDETPRITRIGRIARALDTLRA